MNLSALNVYAAPKSRGTLKYVGVEGSAGDVKSGALLSEAGESFSIDDGVVDFIGDVALAKADAHARDQYDSQAGDFYDAMLDWLWAAFVQDESRVRADILHEIDIQPEQSILEIGCGSGADSVGIAKKMSGGKLFLQDISVEMLGECRRRIADEREIGAAQIEYSTSVACPLPFSDGQFDRVFHFGGLNMFSDIPGALSEMARVTKIGGKVVVGDESVAPWLRNHEFGRMVIANNPLYDAEVPLAQLPLSARNVRVQYMVSNTFYLISFDVGNGAPKLNIDLQHKGRRGGSMRTRFFGQLEGVAPETKEMALRAAAKTGKSMHQWLDELVHCQAKKDLES